MIKIFTNKINIPFIVILVFLIGLLTLFSMLSYWAIEEGNDSKVVYLFGCLFSVFRFPTHTILWELMISGNGGTFAVLFFFGLMFNTIFYAYFIERLIWMIKEIRE